MKKTHIQNVGMFFFLLTGFVFLTILAQPGRANDIRVVATVDKNTATLEDTIALSVTVSGVKNPPDPELPPLPDFRVQASGTSSSMQIINGKVNVSSTHMYRLTPKRTGSFSIDPVKLNLDGAVYASEPIHIEIKETPATGQAMAQNLPVFVELDVSNQKPYVNEQVTVTFKLYRRVDARNIHLNLPLEQFRKEELEKPREYQKVMNGVNYMVHEVSYAIFPSRPGTMQIPEATVDIDIVVRQKGRQAFPHFPGNAFDVFKDDPFFGIGSSLEHKTLRTKPVSIETQPLPEKGKPADFSNLVGKFKISANLGKKELNAGDTTTLTITVDGTGNIQDANIAQPDIQNNFKIYPDQPQLRKNLENAGITGSKIFKFALVPLKDGEMTLPPITLSYFNPETHQYVAEKTAPLILSVKPSQSAESLNVVETQKPDASITPQEIKIVGKDILPIYSQLEDFTDQSFNRERITAYASLFIMPVLLFFSITAYSAYHRRLREDVAFSRTRIAYKTARKKLDRLAPGPAANPKEFARELSQILREYIGDKLNLQGTAFTSNDVEEKLRERRFPEAQTLSARKLLEKLEALQFGLAQSEDTQTALLLSESHKTLEALENQS